MLIVGMIAATVVYRMTGLTHRARFEWGIGQLIAQDAAARTHARNHGLRASMEFELGSGRIVRTQGKSKNDTKSQFLGDNLIVRRFVVPSLDTTTGRATVDYTSEGVSPTYAVELNYNGNSNKPVWLIFVGMTGRVERLEEEREVIRMVKAATTSGNDSR
jgi:hypothetical protein